MPRSKSEQILFDEKLSPFYDINGKEYICKKCLQNIGNSREKHTASCNGKGKQRAKDINYVVNPENYSSLCDMGCGNPALFNYKNGKSYCCKLGAKCPVKVEKDSKLKQGVNPFANVPHHRCMSGINAWNKGLTKETNESLKRQGETFKKTYQLIGDQRKKIHHTEETKARISESTKQRYLDGWHNPTCGRAKSYPYTSPIAGSIHLTGTWEVAFATILDQLGIQWVHNRKRFNYIKPNGKSATYLPDFYVTQWGSYVETKGYFTDLDAAKISQFQEKLIVVQKAEIFQIKKWIGNLDITEQMLIELITKSKDSENIKV